MQEIRFDTEFLNEYFRQIIGKEKIYLEDIERLDNVLIKANGIKITQNDCDILFNTLHNVETDGINLEGLTFKTIEINKLNEATDEDIDIINNIGIDKIVINSFKGLTPEIFDKLNENFKYLVKGDALAQVSYHTHYNKQDMKDIILKMQEIKKCIPENASELMKFMIVYKAIGQANYNDNGKEKNIFHASFYKDKDYADERIISRSLKGVLIGKTAVCEGYAWALARCLDYIDIESRVVAGTYKQDRHSWNHVKIDGVWYATDVTADANSIKSHKYLASCLRSDMYFEKIGYKVNRYDKDIDEEYDIPIEKCTKDYPRTEMKNLQVIIDFIDEVNKELTVGMEEYKENAHSTEINPNILNDIKQAINPSDKTNTHNDLKPNHEKQEGESR